MSTLSGPLEIAPLLISDPSLREPVKRRLWDVLVSGELDVDRAAIGVAWWGTKGGRELVLFGAAQDTKPARPTAASRRDSFKVRCLSFAVFELWTEKLIERLCSGRCSAVKGDADEKERQAHLVRRDQRRRDRILFPRLREPAIRVCIELS